MDNLNARPRLLKQANLSMLRRVLKAGGTATRAELAAETGVSSTTVRSLLSEMLENGEIEPMGFDESSGGRKAERYRFTRDRYYGAAFCLSDEEAHALLVNACGEIVDITRLDAADGDWEPSILAYLDDLTAQKELRSIGVGVPGVVEGGSFWRKRRSDGALYRAALGDTLARRYGVNVVLENDLNATAIGFGRCYEKEFPRETPEETSMAYLHFEPGCVSAGFLAGGRILRGSRNFAGELGLVPMDGKTLLDEYLSAPMDDARYTDMVVMTVGWVCGVLNPQYVTLGGPSFRKDCLGPIGDGLSALLPPHMLPDLLYASDVWHDYHDGMAYLTCEKMFDAVQFIKE